MVSVTSRALVVIAEIKSPDKPLPELFGLNQNLVDTLLKSDTTISLHIIERFLNNCGGVSFALFNRVLAAAYNTTDFESLKLVATDIISVKVAAS